MGRHAYYGDSFRRRRRIHRPLQRRFREVFVKFCAVVSPKQSKLPTNVFQMIEIIAAIGSVKFSSKSELSLRFFGRLKFSGSIFLETLNGRLPLKHSSDRPQTLPKRVSDDPRHFIFRRPQKFFRRFFWTEILGFRYFGQVFEELRPNGPENLLARQILLQIHLS